MLRGQGVFDPGQLRGQLPPFDIRQGIPAGLPELAAYRRFYGLSLPAAQRHSVGTFVSAGETLVAQLFEPADAVATAVVCHGYFDHVGLYGHLIEYLLERRLRVLSFDQPGHGLSTGPRAVIDSFDRYVTALEDLLALAGPALPEDQPWHLLGQSMGGAVSMQHLVGRATDAAPAFREVVLFAPLLRPYRWPVNRLVYQAARRFIDSRPRVITENAENPEFLSLMRRDPLQPDVLPVAWVTAMVDWMRAFREHSSLPVHPKVIQGDADRTVDAAFGLRQIRARSEPEVLLLPGGRHHLVNESDERREQMWRWLDDRCRWD